MIVAALMSLKFPKHLGNAEPWLDPGSGKSHCDVLHESSCCPTFAFINAMPPHALTSREVNLISNDAETSDACTIN